MAVTFQNAAAQPIANAEVIVATIAGPLDNLDAYVSGGFWSNGVLQFFIYATVGAVRAKVASGIYQGPGPGRITWQNVTGAPIVGSVHAGGTSYDLVVFAAPSQSFQPSVPAPIAATFAGVNQGNVVANTNTSGTALVGPSTGEATLLTAAGYTPFVDVSANLVGAPSLIFRIYASCGAGSVEAVVAEAPSGGPDSIAAIIRQAVMPAATSYRLTVAKMTPDRIQSSVTASLASYFTSAPPPNLTGDISVTSSGVVTVLKIQHATVPVSGALVPGNVLQVSGVSDLAYGSVNLAGGVAFVSGVLPAANQANQALGGELTGTTGNAGVPLAGDLTGSASAAVVAKIHGVAVTGAPAAGSVLQATGPTTSQWVPQPAFPSLLPSTSQYHKVGVYSGFSGVSGNVTPGLHYWGFGSITINGTTSSPSGSTATKLDGTKRVRHSATASASRLGIYSAEYINVGVEQMGAWRGNAANRGGFLFRARFAIPVIPNGGLLHAFIGLLEAVGSSSTDFTTDTAIAKIGIGFTATTTAGSQFPAANWQMIQGYHSAPTLIDLGAGFALTIGDFLEVILYAAPNDSQVSYTVNNLTSGATASGVLNVNLPLQTTFLGPYAQTCLQTIVSGTLSFDVSLMYLEMFDG